jgi:bacterioferritin-associated ferredoxin
MGVDRCVCHDLSFERLLAIARAEGLDLDGLRARTRCCTACAMCEPYVREMLRTGVTDLPPMGEAGRCPAGGPGADACVAGAADKQSGPRRSAGRG